VHIETFDPATADEATARAYSGFLRAHAAEQWPDGLPGTHEYVLNRLRHFSADRIAHVWVARDGGSVVAASEVSWWEAPDNRDRAWIQVPFAPEHWSEPRADALVARAAEVLRPLGRTLLMVEAHQDDPVGRWVEARGGKHGSAEELNVFRPASADRDDIAALAAAVPAGYELVAFDGACPDDLLEPLTRLADTMNDAPLDDLTMEDWVYTPERVRRWEEGLAARGHTIWTVLARETSTGELAAFNQLIVRPEWPDVIENEDTAVARPHRGHGLGLWIKAVNLLRVLDERPQAQAVLTWNAASNAHMLRVNRRLGFVCEQRWDTWELPLSEAEPA
jgi:GNAT superfamily N-acetyltransferase